LTTEPFIPLPVFLFVIFLGVLTAVYFYNQAPFIGDKINNIIAEGLLSPKLDAL